MLCSCGECCVEKRLSCDLWIDRKFMTPCNNNVDKLCYSSEQLPNNADLIERSAKVHYLDGMRTIYQV